MELLFLSHYPNIIVIFLGIRLMINKSLYDIPNSTEQPTANVTLGTGNSQTIFKQFELHVGREIQETEQREFRGKLHLLSSALINSSHASAWLKINSHLYSYSKLHFYCHFECHPTLQMSAYQNSYFPMLFKNNICLVVCSFFPPLTLFWFLAKVRLYLQYMHLITLKPAINEEKVTRKCYFFTSTQRCAPTHIHHRFNFTSGLL